MAKISDEDMSKFVATVNKYPNAPKEKVFNAFPWLENNDSLLTKALQFRATYNKYVIDENSKSHGLADVKAAFPEFFAADDNVPQGQQTHQPDQQTQDTNTSLFWNIMQNAELGSNQTLVKQAAQEAEANMAARGEARKERESSSNITAADIANQKAYEQAQAEAATGGSLPGMKMTVDENGKPSLVYDKGNFQFGVPASQEAIEKMPTVVAAKAKLKDYQTLPTDTEDGVVMRVLYAARDNTEYGQKAYKEAQSDVEKFTKEKEDELNEYIAYLQDQINTGKERPEDAIRKQDEFIATLNSEISEYANNRENQMYNFLYEQNKDQVKWQLRQLGMRRTDASIEELSSKINSRMDKLSKIMAEEGWDQYHRINVGPTLEHQEEAGYYRTAQRLLKQAADISAAVRDGKRFGSGFKEGITDLSTWDFGFGDLIQGIDLIKLTNKQERWEKNHKPEDKLTEAEQAVLDAAGIYAMAQAYNADLLSRGYKAGKATAESVPFMLEFMVMPLEEITNATAKKVLQYAARKTAEKAGEKMAKKGFRKTLLQLGGRTLGVGKASLVQTGTFGIPNIAAGTLSGMTGKIEGAFDENGKVVYGGIATDKEGNTTKKSFGTALKDAAVSEISANLSEMAFGILKPLQAYTRAAGVFRRLGQTEIGAAIAEIRRSQIGRVMNRAQWNGIVVEDLEEELDNLIRWAGVSDYSKDVQGLKDAGFNLDDQIDTFLALAPMSLVFGAAGVTSHYGPIAKGAISLRHKLETDAEKKIFDAIMRESRSGKFAERAHNYIRNIVTDPDLTPDGKRVLLEQAFAQYHAEISEKTQKAVDALAEERYGKIFDERSNEGMVNSTDHQIHIGHDSQGRQFVISEGHVVTKDVDGERVLDQDSSDNKFTIRYIQKDGKLSNPIEVPNDFAFGQISTYLPSAERAQIVAQGKAEILGHKTYEYDGKIYSTETGEKISDDEAAELEHQEKVEAEEDVQMSLPKGVEPIDTEKRQVMDQTKFSVTLPESNTPVDIYVASEGHYLNSDGTIDIYDRNGNVDKKKLSYIHVLDSDQVNTGKQKAEYIAALNDKLRSERMALITAAKEKEDAEKKAAEDAKSDEARKQKLQEEYQNALKEERKSIPMKKGKIDYDEATPSQIVFATAYQTQEDGSEAATPESRKEAVESAHQNILFYYKKIEESEKALKDLSQLPAKHLANIKEYKSLIEGYYNAVQRWIGPQESEDLRRTVNRELGIEAAPTQEQILADMVAEVQAMPDDARGKKQIVNGLQQLAEALAMEDDEQNPDKKPCAILNIIQRMRNNLSKMEYKLPIVESGISSIEQALKEQGYEIAEFVQEGKPYNDGLKVIANFETLEGWGDPVIKRVDEPMVMKDGQMIQPAKITVTQYEYETEEEYNEAMEQEKNKKNIEISSEDVFLVKSGRNYTFVQAITDDNGNVTYKNLGPNGSGTVRAIKEDASEGGWVKQDKQSRIVYVNAEGVPMPYYDISSPNAKNARLVPMQVKEKVDGSNIVTISKTLVFNDKEMKTPLKETPSSAGVNDINSIFKRTIFTFADGTSVTIADIFKTFGENGDMSLSEYLKHRAKTLGADKYKDAISAMRREIGKAFNDWTNYVRDNGINYEKVQDDRRLIQFARWLHNLYYVTPISPDYKSFAINSAELPSDAVIESNTAIFAAYLSAAQKAKLISLEDATAEAVQGYVYRVFMRNGGIPILQDIEEKRKQYNSIDSGSFEGLDVESAEDLKKNPSKRAKLTADMRKQYPDILHAEHVDPAPSMSVLTDDERMAYRRKVNANIKKTKQRSATDKLQFSIRPNETTDEAIARTGNEQHADLAFQALQLALNGIRGIKLHKVGGPEEALRVLESLFRQYGIDPELMSVFYGSGAVFNEFDLKYVGTDEADAKITGIEKVEFFKAPNGTILGWAFGNDIYLTDEGLNSETAIHEYTHLWVKALRADNPVAWDRIVKLCKKNRALWNKIKNDPNYANIKNDDNAIASELLSRYSGERGAKRLLEEAKQIADDSKLPADKLADSLVKRMQNVLKEFWELIKDKVFHFTNVSLDDISDMVLKDIFDGKPLNLSEEEMKLIKEKAIKDGTFMKAPNGKPSNLTERQWLQVRTKTFKEWNGEWELAALLRQAENAWNNKDSKNKFVFSPSPRLADAYKKKLGHEIKSIVITDDAIRHIKNYHSVNEELRGQVNLTPEDIVLIPYLLNNFDTMDYDSAYDDNKGNKAVVIKKRINGVSIVATIEKGKDREFVVTNWQFVKSNALDASKKTPGLNVRNDFDAAKVQKEIDICKENAKKSSKILDENGEPRIVYHGTDRAGFDTFVPRDIRYDEEGRPYFVDNLRAIFTTPQRPIASVYAKGIDEDIEEAKIGDQQAVQKLGRFMVLWPDNAKDYFDTEQDAEQFLYDLGFTGEEEDSPEIVDLGAERQNAVYSLFMNIKNPLVVDYSDESGNPREWDRYATGKYLVFGNGIATKTFDSQEEAEQWVKKENLPTEGENAVVITPEIIDTDTWCARALANGHDGVIFKNIIDGSMSTALIGTEYYGKGHEVICAFYPNQVKSATQNNGMFSLYDDRIQFSIADAAAEDVTEKRNEDFEKADRVLIRDMAKASILKDRNLRTIEKLVTRALDTTEGIRRMMNSINAFRKMVGLPPIDSEHDIRTRYESATSTIHNKTIKMQDSIGKKYTEAWQKVTDEIRKSSFYEKYKAETSPYGSRAADERKKIILTPLQLLERYLMAVDNLENRYPDKKERGIIETAARLTGGYMDKNENSSITREQAKAIVEKFVKEFEASFGNRNASGNMISDLWKAIKDMTDFALKENMESGNLSKSKYEELRSKKFYVPQRGNFHRDEEQDNKEEQKPTDKPKSISIDSLRKAKGGKSLGCTPIAFIARDAEEAIEKGERNKVKILMYELLRENAAWCNGRMPVPAQVHFEIDPNDEKKQKVIRVTEDVEDFRRNTIEQLNNEINEIDAKLRNKDVKSVDEVNALEERRQLLQNQIELSLTTAETAAVYAGTEQDANSVPLMIDGVLHEIQFSDRYTYVAQSLKWKRDDTGEIKAVRWVGGLISATFTVNNPGFFVVNLIRDIPFVLTKGASAYGPEFVARFITNLFAGMGAVGRYATAENSLWLGKYMAAQKNQGPIHMQFNNFLAAGGNTGYSNLEDVQKFRSHVRELAPGLNYKDMTKSEKIKATLKGAAKVAHNVVGVAQLRPLANALNEYSELITRFAIYKSIVDMRLGENEAVKAAHNLSVNFNRKAYGVAFLNFFNSLSLFANATIQGASGFFRGFYKESTVLKGGKSEYVTQDERAHQALSMTISSVMVPAALGFLDTLLNPDDDDYIVSDWDRDNYVIFGDWRLPLNEQLKPAWVIGVNAALLIKKRRTWDEARNSVGTSVLRNWLPVAPNIIDATFSAFDKEQTWANSLIAALVPASFQSIYSVARNENFLGGKLRFDIPGIPEYMTSPNESELLKDFSYVLYKYPGHGRTDLNTEGRRDMGTTYLGPDREYEKIKRTWNVNPRELRAMTFFVPSGALDIWAMSHALIKDAVQGNKLGTSVRLKDIIIANRLHREQNMHAVNSGIVKKAEQLSSDLMGPVSDLTRTIMGNAAHASIDRRKGTPEDIDNANREQEKAYEIRDKELYPNFRDNKESKSYMKYVTGYTLDILVRAYKTVDHNRIARSYGLNDIKEFDEDIQLIMPETAEELDSLENEICVNIDYIMNLYKGLEPSRLGNGAFELVPEDIKGLYGVGEKK